MRIIITEETKKNVSNKYILKKIIGNQVFKYSNLLHNESGIINEMEKHGLFFLFDCHKKHHHLYF